MSNETCSKMKQHTARNFGKTYKTQCQNPVFKDGLCQGHYKRSVEKSTNWIDRYGYRAATQQDLDTGRSLKLRNSNQHVLYMQRKGAIKTFSKKDNRYVECDLPADPELFCVLDFSHPMTETTTNK